MYVSLFAKPPFPPAPLFQALPIYSRAKKTAGHQ
jgi:hypothetical protein